MSRKMGGAPSHDAADEMDRALSSWNVELNTLDADLKDKERIEALVYDLYRNNDLYRGIVEKHVDTIIGSRVILQCTPDYEGLGGTATEAKAWAKRVERDWNKYANSPENFISADRSMDFTQLCRAATKQHQFSGEIVASREWRASGLGYKTCFNLISSNRLKNPKTGYLDSVGEAAKSRGVFHGIEFDRFGAAIAYHISSFTRGGEGAGLYTEDGRLKTSTKRYLKYNRLGVQQIFHIYEPLKPEYPRGISRATSVIKKIKQLERFNQADLEKAIIATSYAIAVTSPLGPEDVAAMLTGAGDYMGAGGGFSLGDGASKDAMPKAIKDDYEKTLKEICDRYIDVQGGKWVHLFNDEKIEMLQPHANMGLSENYATSHARNIANGIGMSYELGSGDFRGISFSGGQLSLGIYEHSANVTRKLYIHKFARLCFRAWLDEYMDKPNAPLINGMSYRENRECYTVCDFSGARRVHVDPVKNARATSLDLQNGVISRTAKINAEGGDIEQVVRERASEADLMLEAIRGVAAEKGLTLTPEAETQIIIDIIATKQVDTPEIVIEGEDNVQESS